MRSRIRIASISLAALAALAGCSSLDRDGGSSAVKMSINDVPAPVRATLQAHAKGATLNEVEEETENGKTVYESEVMIDGKEVELTVAEDGTLLSREVEDDDDAEDDDGEDDDADEDEDDDD